MVGQQEQANKGTWGRPPASQPATWHCNSWQCGLCRPALFVCTAAAASMHTRAAQIRNTNARCPAAHGHFHSHTLTHPPTHLQGHHGAGQFALLHVAPGVELLAHAAQEEKGGRPNVPPHRGTRRGSQQQARGEGRGGLEELQAAGQERGGQGARAAVLGAVSRVH